MLRCLVKALCNLWTSPNPCRSPVAALSRRRPAPRGYCVFRNSPVLHLCRPALSTPRYHPPQPSLDPTDATFPGAGGPTETYWHSLLTAHCSLLLRGTAPRSPPLCAQCDRSHCPHSPSSRPPLHWQTRSPQKDCSNLDTLQCTRPGLLFLFLRQNPRVVIPQESDSSERRQ